MQTDWSVVLTFLPQLLAGAKITVQITIIGLVGGAMLGSLLIDLQPLDAPAIH